MFLVERLDSLIANGTKLPFGNNVMVDQLQAQELLDQLRAAVPEEIRQAKRVNQESERILERAQEEAEHVKARAQEQAAFLIGEQGLTLEAERRSDEMLRAAAEQSEEIRRGADEYAASVLIRLEGECVKALQSIKRGLAMLDARRVPTADVTEVDEGAADAPGYEDATADARY
jgi:cell division septum initiation protein DivIVA